ncbi:hypothetical protein [uncultured Pseudomonas sp.]|uniref:hypothetical protein n=1 Tax=uncultured Pseudomonas sp. TaxID=114707 RepID=UPI0025D15525|nr:hypothetical protein [uncultured Pseudomonas sp.]
MSDNSLQSLLEWMANPTTEILHGWDSIAALSRDKCNLLLAQAYIARFDSASYLPPISGRVTMVEGSFEQHIHDFVLDVPRLSFENANIDDSRARLSMSVMGGVQVAMKKDVDIWSAVRVDEIDPLQGPRLELELELDRVPGSVEAGGRVLLDLKHSDNFSLTFAQTEHERRLGGEFFKDLFNQLPDEQRLFVLGKIQPNDQLLLSPQSFRLRTQSKGQGDADGAILILICMQQSNEGAIPGTGYRYLIADDAGKDYSATVLLDRERVFEAGVLEMVADMIGGYHFTYQRDEYGKLLSATTTAGALEIAPMLVPMPLPQFPGDGQFYILNVLCENLRFSAAAPHELKVTFNDQKAKLSWSATANGDLRLSLQDMDDVFVSGEISFDVQMEAEYELSAVDLTIKRSHWEPIVRPIIPPEPPEQARGGVKDLLLAILKASWHLISISIGSTLALGMVLASIEVHMVLLQQLNKSLEALVRDSIRLNFSQSIVADALYLPHDLGAFGRIDPVLSTFAVTPMQPLIGAGETCLFGTLPAVAGLSWSVDDLQRSGREAGSIDQNGLYQAPAASAIEGRFLRVRVTARDPQTLYQSSALLTIVPSGLTVNPLIQLCDIGGRVELAAGQLGEGSLFWSIRDPVTGESGSLQPSDKPDGDHSYVATTQPIAHRSYVLDEIEVRNDSTGHVAQAHVLVLLEAPVLSIKVAQDAALAAGQVQLQAWKGSSQRKPEWSLPLGGPGSIDADGLYTADPQATERFVLVMAREDLIELVDLVFEGHIILPLPLADFPNELAALSVPSPTI